MSIFRKIKLLYCYLNKCYGSIFPNALHFTSMFASVYFWNETNSRWTDLAMYVQYICVEAINLIYLNYFCRHL